MVCSEIVPLIAIIAISANAVVSCSSIEDVQRLITTLFSNYSTLVRPARNQNLPTLVNSVFHIKQIDELDMKSQVMRSLGYLSINWTDDVLQWREEDYAGIKYITMPESKVWKPDYVLNNDVNDKTGIGNGASLVVIFSNGQVLWEPGYVGSTLCQMDITYFPFDKQTCYIRITSWMTANSSLQSMTSFGVSISTYRINGEFELIGVGAEVTYFPMTFVQYEYLEGIAFKIMVKRRTTFYWLSLVAPMIMMPMLCPLSFLVPSGSGEKTTLAITYLLSVFVFLDATYDTLPKLSNTTSYLVVMAATQVILSFTTVMCNVFILTIHGFSRQTIPEVLTKIMCKYWKHRKSIFHIENPRLCDNLVNNGTAERSEITWPEVARFLNAIGFSLSLLCVVLINAVFITAMLYS